jgi:GT2 family glycosyltransferase
MLSLVIPTHDRQELLKRKLELLREQTLKEFEVVVVADGCQDGTLAFLADYRPPYPLRVLEGPGQGAAWARNRGAEAASGTFVLFSDDDTFPEPDLLEVHLQAQRASPGVYQGASRWESGAVWRPRRRGPWLRWTSMLGSNLSLPRELLIRLGGFWEGFTSYGVEDLELAYRLVRAGLRIRYLPEAREVHAGGPSLGDTAKAFSAGQQAVWAVRRHQDPRLAWELGVHPWLLLFKRLIYALPVSSPRWRYEAAYAQGAYQAWRSR